MNDNFFFNFKGRGEFLMRKKHGQTLQKERMKFYHDIHAGLNEHDSYIIAGHVTI